MTKSKNTKRALLASVLSMLLCLSMLVGSTFAWFTDTVKSGTNKIVAGNLNVELYHTNAIEKDEKVVDTTKLFMSEDGSVPQWEPGVMVYENFTVKNEGTLALKYALTLNAECNTVDGKSLKDVLKVAILEEAFSGKRADAEALTFNKTVSDFEKPGTLAKDESNTYAVVIWWKPSDDESDNAYNFNNERKDFEALYINLGVTLLATQTAAENDSFGNDYDEGVELPVSTSNGLLEALSSAKAGDEIKMSAGNYELPKEYTIAEGVTITGAPGTVLTVDGGKTSNITAQTSNYGLLISSDNVTIKNVTLEAKNIGSNEYDAFIEINGNNVTIENVTINSASNSSPIVIAKTKSDDMSLR